ncbi:MAG: RNA polymerase sigma factor [Phycisphaerae bacterium]|nr:RNA polymerase sigma factor [Phycisphaerae bacterium]
MAKTLDYEILVEKFSRGDETAFDRIVEGYSADIAVLANRLLGWPGDVEDIVQDVFLAAFVGLKKFRCECSLKSWLFTITINKCRSYRYKQILYLRFFSRASVKASAVLNPNADNVLMKDETFDKVRLAVQALPLKYREPVVLRYLQELSIEETARILSISKNALQVRLSRARERLRRDLTELIG